MNQEAQRIAIAEACGFTDITFSPLMGFHQQKSDERAKECGGRWRFAIPDYLSDLNAMAEAEKIILDREIGARFRLELCKNSEGPQSMFMTAEAAMCHATAAQRAEAFLKTLNLWEHLE